MGRTCKVCLHPEREAIDRALVAGRPAEQLAREFGMSNMSLTRHAGKHLPEVLAKAREAEEAAHADDLLSQVQGLQRRTLAILSAAEGERFVGLDL